MIQSEVEELTKLLENDLLRAYESPILTLGQLQIVLRYSSVAAVKQAIYRQTFPVRTFVLPNRHGRYALVKDVARFIAKEALREKGGS